MRRALVVVMSTLLIGFGMGAWAAPGHAAPDSSDAARGKADTRSVTVNVEFLRRSTTFPAGNQTSYYCAIGAFVPFNDINGYVPDEATYVAQGTTPETVGIMDAPYDDGAVINIPASGGASLNFNAVPGTHHQQLGGYTYAQGPNPYDCQTELNNLMSYYSKTAVVTYVRSEACQAAADKLDKAQKAFKKAAKRANSTTGAAHQQALVALERAKAKLAKAKKKYKLACK